MSAPRIDRASRVVAASPAQVWGAMSSPDALAEWLPPAGMTGRFEHFDLRPGGSYRLVLTHADPAQRGKSSGGSDVVEVRFVDVAPCERIVQAVDFESDDPAFARTMTMTWSITTEGDDGSSTRVDIVAEDVPPGISAEDHAEGMASSLENLARFLR